ncbi:DUF6470 family protein [Paenibacillus methanolicus]|uniref:YviE n=1 Tax=Paenibacillus methanolicus TaxID=582686 RepID=A0A5S5C8Q7_9BACL|nr:DUF6470 family protein [Paenibacillus methanolicus]TYP75724.1 hypothetical protein BCM02_104405 [Paenibacillus methanolicus]
MRIPQIQIHQEYAQIGLQTTPAQQEIEQPGPTIEMKQTSAKLTIEQTEGQLTIDQSRARDALALGNNLETMKRIYAKASQLAMSGIARTVEKGNQMAAIHQGGNPIAESAKDWRRTFPEFAFEGEASMDNVDIEYKASKPIIDVQQGGVEYNVTPNRAEHHYTPGKVEVYLRQMNRVEITPPVLDMMK